VSPRYRTRVRQVSCTYRSRCVKHVPDPHKEARAMWPQCGLEPVNKPIRRIRPLTCINTLVGAAGIEPAASAV
jgi:hypothetical protein